MSTKSFQVIDAQGFASGNPAKIKKGAEVSVNFDSGEVGSPKFTNSLSAAEFVSLFETMSLVYSALASQDMLVDMFGEKKDSARSIEQIIGNLQNPVEV